MHILTFAKKPFKLKNPHMVDVILDEKSTNIDGFRLGMSSLVCRMMIENHTNENDVVYDPFMGSGVLEVGRNYLGSEINEEYYNLCKKRIQSDLTLQ